MSLGEESTDEVRKQLNRSRQMGASNDTRDRVPMSSPLGQAVRSSGGPVTHTHVPGRVIADDRGSVVVIHTHEVCQTKPLL